MTEIKKKKTDFKTDFNMTRDRGTFYNDKELIPLKNDQRICA